MNNKQFRTECQAKLNIFSDEIAFLEKQKQVLLDRIVFLTAHKDAVEDELQSLNWLKENKLTLDQIQSSETTKIDNNIITFWHIRNFITWLNETKCEMKWVSWNGQIRQVVIIDGNITLRETPGMLKHVPE